MDWSVCVIQPVAMLLHVVVVPLIAPSVQILFLASHIYTLFCQNKAAKWPTPWFTEETRGPKQACRTWEGQWSESKLEVFYLLWHKCMLNYKCALFSAKIYWMFVHPGRGIHPLLHFLMFLPLFPPVKVFLGGGTVKLLEANMRYWAIYIKLTWLDYNYQTLGSLIGVFTSPMAAQLRPIHLWIDYI